jgi:cyclic pyranopterin phosphate synthase
VRFIELMNTGSARAYVSEVFMAGHAVVEHVRRAMGVRPVARRHPSDPAALYETRDGLVFGVIASDTEPFCDACDRMRLTADGRLRGCLYESGGVPLGALLKTGVDDDQLRALIGVALDDKRSHHPLVAPDRVPFSMADVGG